MGGVGAVERRGVVGAHLVVGQHHEHVGVAEVLHHHCSARVGAEAPFGPHECRHHGAVDDPVDGRGRHRATQHRRRHEGAGGEGGAERLVHEHGVDGAEAHAAVGLGHGDAERAEPGQLDPQR